jgi:diadenosine tetraphosphate (Ap4A) HIT family hydrolase
VSSPFLELPESAWVASNALAFAIRDRFPVSPGHTLVIPRRPDGYNVGFNAGEAAGQTVMHLHLHVIPRYRGDMEDPRGGVRHVIPGKGNYLASGAAGASACV